MNGGTAIWPIVCLAIAVYMLQTVPESQAGEPVLTLEVGSARMELGRGDILDASLTRSITDQDSLEVNLTPDMASALEKFTTTLVGQQIDIRFGDRILSSPHIVEPITNGGFAITPVSREDARAIIKLLD